MNPGSLDTLIRIETPSNAVDAVGDATLNWEGFSTWSTVKDVPSATAKYAEAVIAGQRDATSHTVFTVRASRQNLALDCKCRIKYLGAYYTIIEPERLPTGRPEFIKFTCRRRTD